MEKDLNNLSKQDVIALFKQQQEALFLAQSQQEKILSQSQELIQQNQKLSQAVSYTHLTLPTICSV